MTKQQPNASERSEPARALDPKYYFDPEIFERERERIFYRTWQFICHDSEVSGPGGYFVRRILDQEIVVVRQKDAGLKAFYNVCMHRAHPVFTGSGIHKSVVACPYHGWCYELDGRLRRAPQTEDVAGFDPAEIHLSEVRLELFCGFIFVNMDDSASSLASQTQEIGAEIHQLVPGIDGFGFVDEVALEHHCNWKVTVENYSECYHCRIVHGNALFDNLDISTYSLRIHGATSSHFCEPKAEYVPADCLNPMMADDAFASWFLWPNFSINRQPGGFIRVGLFDPLAIDRTLYRYRYYSNGEMPNDEVVAYMQRHAEFTGAEDAELVEKIQTGLRSRGYKPGPLVIDGTDHGEREHGVHHFQSLVLQALDAPDL